MQEETTNPVSGESQIGEASKGMVSRNHARNVRYALEAEINEVQKSLDNLRLAASRMERQA